MQWLGVGGISKIIKFLSIAAGSYWLLYQTLYQLAQSPIQLVLELLMGWDIHSVSGQPVLWSHCPLSEKLPHVPSFSLKQFPLVLSLYTCVKSWFLRFFSWIFDWNSIHSIWKLAGNVFTSTENGVTNTLKDLRFFFLQFSKLFLNSSIKKKKKKKKKKKEASLHIFHCSRDYVYLMYQIQIFICHNLSFHNLSFISFHFISFRFSLPL